MKKILSLTTVTLLVAGISIGTASAKSHHRPGAKIRSHVTTGSAPVPRGNNAELMGNNGNSGQGSNSLGHIKGGNVGGGM